MLATFEALKQYEKTFHFIGQVQIALDSEKPRQASAYVYTIAHHVITKENGEKSLMIAYLRYDDSFEKPNLVGNLSIVNFTQMSSKIAI